MRRDTQSLFLFSLRTKKKISWLRKITVEPLDYFTNVFATFLGLGTFNMCCCLCRDGKLSDCIKNMNEGLTGLEQHEGE